MKLFIQLNRRLKQPNIPYVAEKTDKCREITQQNQKKRMDQNIKRLNLIKKRQTFTKTVVIKQGEYQNDGYKIDAFPRKKDQSETTNRTRPSSDNKEKLEQIEI